MSILTLILALLAVAVLLGLINWAARRTGMIDANVLTFLNIAVIVILVIWLMKALGLFSALSSITV